jgi:hypothetical protein
MTVSPHHFTTRGGLDLKNYLNLAKMKNKLYHTVRKVPKSNQKVVEIEAHNCTPSTQMHGHLWYKRNNIIHKPTSVSRRIYILRRTLA